MNRDDKRRMIRVVQSYDRSLRTAYSEFEREINDMKDKESEKLEALPSSFEASQLVEKLSDAVDMFDTVLEKAEDIMNTLDEILGEVDVKSNYTQVTRTTKIKPEKKNVSFHALLSSSLLERLRDKALRAGLSMNEIVCQALLKELKD